MTADQIEDAWIANRITDSDLWDAAYPDGDPWGNSIRVYANGTVTRNNQDGRGKTEYASLAEAYDHSREALASCYDGDDGEDVYEVAAVEELADRAAESGWDFN